jgi:copper transport protein
MAFVLAGPPRSAFGHAEYQRSDPAADAVIHAAPARVDVWFTQPLFRRAGANTVVVTDGSGARVNTGEAVLDDADRTHMSVVLPVELADGEYTVVWTTLSATDGDSADGSFRFTIDRSAPDHSEMTPTPPEQLGPPAGSGATAGDSDAAFPWWAAVAALGVLGAGGAGAWALLGRDPE